MKKARVKVERFTIRSEVRIMKVRDLIEELSYLDQDRELLTVTWDRHDMSRTTYNVIGIAYQDAHIDDDDYYNIEFETEYLYNTRDD